ncbi:mechanosensitive ion channel family protein [Flammeovirgaceae bacterium SG7u.111]|nr:mechanosensitive ion channel family protein [Flammeovirgaceae bacterium SG7u.132]WPO37870.1 mechanosensitive ion channel family protein [Flammeovirgaceae bacterium SG7u.111]
MSKYLTQLLKYQFVLVFIYLFIIGAATTAGAQFIIEVDDISYSVSTPRKAVISHLGYLEKSNFYPPIASQTLYAPEMSLGKKINLIIKLKQIFQEIGYLQVYDIPDRRNYNDADRKRKYVLFEAYPSIYLEKVDGDWLYSQETVLAIQQIHDKLFATSPPKVVKKASEASAEVTQKGKSEKNTVVVDEGDPLDLESEEVVKELKKLEKKYEDELSEADVSLDYKFSTATPFNTIMSLDYFLSETSFRPTLAGKTLAGNLPEEQKIILSIKLKQILEGRGVVLRYDKIPKDANFQDTLSSNASGQKKYVISNILPEVYLEKVGDEWLFSNHTVKLIPRMHSSVYLLGTDLLETFVSFIQKYLGTNIYTSFSKTFWKDVGFGLFIFSGLLVFWVLKLIFFLLNKVVFKDKDKRAQFSKFTLSLCYTLSIMLFVYLIPSIGLHAETLVTSVLIAKLMSLLFSTNTLFRLVDFVVFFILQKAHDSPSKLAADSKGLTPFIGIFLKIIIFFGAVILLFRILNVDTTKMLTGLSIGGLAVALAAQESIKNFIGSIMIFLDRPFKVGDFVRFGTNLGTIENIGLRSTRIRTPEHSLISVPNGNLINMDLNNLGMRQYRRYKTLIRLGYDTPLKKVNKYVESLRKMVEEHPKTRKDVYHIYMHELGKYSLDVLFYIYFEVPEYGDELACRQEMIQKIIRLAEKQDIKFAIPQVASSLDDGQA